MFEMDDFMRLNKKASVCEFPWLSSLIMASKSRSKPSANQVNDGPTV